MNQRKHLFIMYNILRDIYMDSEINNLLGFKGGTSMMFFHNLTRFSTDLNFNILHVHEKDFLYDKMQKLLSKYGTIADMKMKHFGPIIVLNDEKGERKLKVEMSTRVYNNHYEIKNLAGVNLPVMHKADVFAHKLCALEERMTGRDVYDVYFFLKNYEAVNEEIIRERKGKSLIDFIKEDCIPALERCNNKELMGHVGDLLNSKEKNDMRNGKILQFIIDNLNFFTISPQIKEFEEPDIESVSIIKLKNGNHAIKAKIDGFNYMDKELSSMEYLNYLAHNKEEKEKYLYALAKHKYKYIGKQKDISKKI